VGAGDGRKPGLVGKEGKKNKNKIKIKQKLK
jgi:hypothetical protein